MWFNYLRQKTYIVFHKVIETGSADSAHCVELTFTLCSVLSRTNPADLAGPLRPVLWWSTYTRRGTLLWGGYCLRYELSSHQHSLLTNQISGKERHPYWKILCVDSQRVWRCSLYLMEETQEELCCCVLTSSTCKQTLCPLRAFNAKTKDF